MSNYNIMNTTSRNSWFIYSSTFEKHGKWMLCNRPFYKNNEYNGQLISSTFFQRIIDQDIIEKERPYKTILAFGVLFDYSYEEAKQLTDNIMQPVNPYEPKRIYLFTLTHRQFMKEVENIKINNSKRIVIRNSENNTFELSVRYIQFNGSYKYVISTPNYQINNPVVEHINDTLEHRIMY